MNQKRKTFQADFISRITQLGVDPRNMEMYEGYFKELSDDDFEVLIDSILAGEYTLPVFSFNMSDTKLNLDTIMKVGEELGIRWFQQLRLTDPISNEVYTTVPEYLVLQLEIRRQIQHLVKKRSTAADNRSVDYLSGQVTGGSKGASITLPELTVLNAKDLHDPLIELIKVNGGDKEARDNMLKQLRETGGFSLKPIMELESRPKAITTTNSFLKGMMLVSTL